MYPIHVELFIRPSVETTISHEAGSHSPLTCLSLCSQQHRPDQRSAVVEPIPVKHDLFYFVIFNSYCFSKDCAINAQSKLQYNGMGMYMPIFDASQ